MKFIIADTFQRSLSRLDGESQKLIKQAAFEFQCNPAHPSFQFHKIDRAKDKRFSSARVNRDLRLIIHRDGSHTLMLCYADHHDAAYAWAERRVLEVHPETGAVQLVEVEEVVREVVKEVVREKEPPLFAQYERDYLSALGVPARWLDAVFAVGEEGFLDLAENLPTAVAERLLELAEGKPVPRPASATTGATADPYAHPDSQRHFRVMNDRDALERALDAPWDQWLVFLHPDQRRYAEADYRGPVRVYGGAGTGKTVVAVHRAVRLAREGRGKVLLTTFSKTLAGHLRRQVRLLAGDDRVVTQNLQVEHLHRLTMKLYSQHSQTRFEAAKDSHVSALLEQHAKSRDEDPTFVRDEFWSVVDAQGLTDFEGYKTAPRAGRGTPIGLRRRKALWQIFESVLGELAAENLSTWSGLVGQVTAALSARKPGYSHVVVDEAQDFGAAELKLVRALVPAGENDVFLCGDEGQRIYKPAFRWSALGLDVRGRSFRLKVNYRTTAQIRREADHLLPRRLQDADGEPLERGAVSPLSGPDPERGAHKQLGDEVAGLAAWLEACEAAGIPRDQIAILARTEKLLEERALPALAQRDLSQAGLDEQVAPDQRAVHVGTMHRAKGLEFRAIAVIGCDNNKLPPAYLLKQATDPGDRAALEERERNLLYVACTRARERLLVSWVGKPAQWLG